MAIPMVIMVTNGNIAFHDDMNYIGNGGTNDDDDYCCWPCAGWPQYNCPTAYTCGAQARHGVSQAGREQHTIELFFYHVHTK